MVYVPAVSVLATKVTRPLLPIFAWSRSSRGFDAPTVPLIANRSASASVDFPLPLGPIMQINPCGKVNFKPGKKPPLSSMLSSVHISSLHNARFRGPGRREKTS
jgi:hypothetical protein